MTAENPLLSVDAIVRRLNTAIPEVCGPVLALDLVAMRANAADLRRRAVGTPIRAATKSLRVDAVTDMLLRDGPENGFAGAMAFAAAEAIHLARRGMRDVLVGYPTVDHAAIAEIGADPDLRERITLMIDSVDHIEFLHRVAGPSGIRVCIDVDASLRVGPVHLGVRRSPLRAPADVARVATAARATGLRVVGVMFYEAQVAGMPDTAEGWAHRLRERAIAAVKKRTMAELAFRRAAVVDAVVDAVGSIDMVNSGGTGSLSESAADPVVTEVTAGSGLFGPTLFDLYRDFRPYPALMYALPIVRTPTRRIATAFSGGYIASGPPSPLRSPTPVAAFTVDGVAVPVRGLLPAEGAGEVQSPLRHDGTLRAGDRVWLRHAKSGEVCERFDQVHLVEADGSVEVVPTYRGAGLCFG